MPVELSTGAEARWTGKPGPRAVVCVNGGTAAEVPGTWSASVEWLVRRLSRRFPELGFLEVRYRIKSWQRLDLCVEDGPPRSTRRATAGRGSSRCSASRWAAPSPSGTPPPTASSSSRASTRGCRRSSSSTALRGRRLAIVHGALDAPLPADPRREAVDVRCAPPPRAGARASTSSVESSRSPSTRSRCGAATAVCSRSPALRATASFVGDRAGALLRVGLYGGIRRRRARARASALPDRDRRAVPPGPCIVAANHESMLDPPLLALAARRPLHFLAKVELWRYRPGAWLMDALGGIPIRRDRTRPALGRPCRGAAARRRERRDLPAGDGAGRRLDARRGPARARHRRAARPGADRGHEAGALARPHQLPEDPDPRRRADPGRAARSRPLPPPRS